MGKKRCVVAGLMIICLSVPLTAQAEKQPAQEKIQLDNIVVSATKTEKSIDDVPGSVTVISRDKLKEQNIQTVDDAISSISGVFVKRTKGLMDSTSSVYMRGFKGDQYTLVLLDGQPLNDAYGGNVEWGALSVGNIERIEVIRGPASALYGGNAMGGVVNIITRSPEKLEAEAGGGYGTNNTRRYHLSVGNKFTDKLSVHLGYENESTDGYETTPVVRSVSSGVGTVSGGYPMNDKYGDATRWVVGDKGENGAERRSFDGKLNFDFSDTGRLSLTVVSGRHEYDYGPPNTYMGTFGGSATTYAIAGTGKRASFHPNDFISYTGIGKNDNDVYTLAFEEIFDTVQVNAQVGTVQNDDRYTTESGSGAADYSNSPGSMKITENESWFAELRGNVPLGDTHLFTMGVSYRTDSSDTNDYDIPFYRSYSGAGSSTFYSGGESKSWAVFSQDEWQIIDPLTIYLGLRYDTWKVEDGKSGVPGAETEYAGNTESELSPKVSAVWNALDDTTIRASVGHAFRAPTLYELYRTWQSWGKTYQSNPNLKPETVWTYEMGVDQYFLNKKTKLSLTGYRNDIDDLIYYQTSGSTKTRINAGKARTYGLELEASQKLTDWLSLWGNVTYTDAKIVDNPTDVDSEDKRVTGIPETAWNLGLDSHYKWFKGSIVGRYYGKTYGSSSNTDVAEGVYGTYEPSFLVDAKVTVSPMQWMDMSFSVDNIFDKEYYQYYKGDGRTFFVELTCKY